jgi:phosphate transport system substrate-binding protein
MLAWYSVFSRNHARLSHDTTQCSFNLTFCLLLLVTVCVIIWRVIRCIALLAIVAVLAAACTPSSSSQGEGAVALYSIQNVGSDTMVNLALAWAETYQGEHTDTRIAVTGGGSGTGIAALINGTIDIANASRQIKPEEIERAEANAIVPVEHVVARDAIAVIVHPSNPVSQLTLEQISAMYTGELSNWQQVGGENCPIVLLSRETNSGTHVFFLEEVIRLGDSQNKSLFSSETLLLPSSEGITAEVRQNPNAIGYDGLGYVTADVKMVAVARDAAGPFVLPSIASVDEGSYPIARDLYMYTAGQPSGPISTYLAWIVGTAGQQIVAELGFVPLAAGHAASNSNPLRFASRAGR